MKRARSDVRMRGQRGDVAIYIALMMLSIMLSGALLYSLILARQIRATGAAVDSERAFYAANTGLEHSLYLVTRQFQENIDSVTGTVVYPVVPGEVAESEATYEAQGSYNVTTGTVCLHSRGNYRVQRRNIELTDPGC